MSKLSHIIAKVRSIEESAIQVKKGAFHAWLGKSPDQKITEADIKKGLAAGGHAAKMAEFAQNFGHVGEETITEEHKVLDVSKDEYGNRFELHAHNVGHSSEWHGIHKTHQHGEKVSSTSTIGKPKYVAKKWAELKAQHRNPNISYPGVPKMGQVKEETLDEASSIPKTLGRARSMADWKEMVHQHHGHQIEYRTYSHGVTHAHDAGIASKPRVGIYKTSFGAITSGGIVSSGGIVHTPYHEVKEETLDEAVGDVKTVHQHKNGVDMGRYGKFNVAHETTTHVSLYDHKHPNSKIIKFNKKTGRGIGDAEGLMIKDMEEGTNEETLDEVTYKFNDAHKWERHVKAHGLHIEYEPTGDMYAHHPVHGEVGGFLKGRPGGSHPEKDGDGWVKHIKEETLDEATKTFHSAAEFKAHAAKKGHTIETEYEEGPTRAFISSTGKRGLASGKTGRAIHYAKDSNGSVMGVYHTGHGHGEYHSKPMYEETLDEANRGNLYDGTRVRINNPKSAHHGKTGIVISKHSRAWWDGPTTYRIEHDHGHGANSSHERKHLIKEQQMEEQQMEEAVLDEAKPRTLKVMREAFNKGGHASRKLNLPSTLSYNADAVNKSIKSSRQKISGREAKAIHRLLKGRHG